jgi:hypothetical protein
MPRRREEAWGGDEPPESRQPLGLEEDVDIDVEQTHQRVWRQVRDQLRQLVNGVSPAHRHRRDATLLPMAIVSARFAVLLWRSRLGLAAAEMAVKACLNGGRTLAEHAAVPQAPGELAADALAARKAGAFSVHVHPRDPGGAQTLEAGVCDAAVEAIRAAVPSSVLAATISAAGLISTVRTQ